MQLISVPDRILVVDDEPKARKAVKAKIRDIIARGGATPATDLVKQINATVAGWVNYFRVGNASRAFSEVRDYVEMKVRVKNSRMSGWPSKPSFRSCRKVSVGCRYWPLRRRTS